MIALEEPGVEVLVEKQFLDLVDHFILVDDPVDEDLELIPLVFGEGTEQTK